MPAEAHALTDPRFRRALTQMVRRRVPESDAEDIVQSSLAEALASTTAPDEMDALRRFVWGIARHKVADFYRRARREKLDVPEMEGPGAPHNEHDLLRWAARELPEGKDAEQTLDWMLREGEGEKLEAIAEAENLPAPRVRQRVSRLRRHLRERWAVEIAALAAIGVVVALIVWEMNRQPGKPITNEGPVLREEPKLKAPTPPKSLPGTTDVPNGDPILAPPTSSSDPSPMRTAPTAVPTGTPMPRSSAVPSKPQPKPSFSKTSSMDSPLDSTPLDSVSDSKASVRPLDGAKSNGGGTLGTPAPAPDPTPSVGKSRAGTGGSKKK